ncbi:MAG TPA: nitroreductase/quinone reductase family protein [Galbitalea sp.]|jgi:deazaflavin-dependent oxidoreductase (nitroreductase family)
MSFNSTNGTRGGRPPKANALTTWFNNRAIKRVRNKGGKVMGNNLLVLNTIGKKSGAARAVPVGWLPSEHGTWLIVASASGSARNPAWYYNIAANPDKVSIDIDRKHVPVIPEQLHDEERDRAWAAIVAAAPQFARYETKTDRVIPIIRLTPR